MCGDSGINMAAPRLDDSASIDDLVDERDYPGLTCKLRKLRVYTVGHLRERGVWDRITGSVSDSQIRALQEMLDDNDGREP